MSKIMDAFFIVQSSKYMLYLESIIETLIKEKIWN